MSVFSDRLKQLRLDKKENQSDVAAILGVSVQSYSAYEASREPKYDLLCKLADHFGVTTDFLLGKSNAENFQNVMLVDELGLTEKSISSIKRLSAYAPILPGDDNRSLVEVLNLFIEEDSFPMFIALLKKLTDPTKVKWGAYQWEGEEKPTPFQLSHEIAEDSAWKTLLQDVLNGNIESIRKECANKSAPYFKKIVATIEKDD